MITRLAVRRANPLGISYETVRHPIDSRWAQRFPCFRTGLGSAERIEREENQKEYEYEYE